MPTDGIFPLVTAAMPASAYIGLHGRCGHAATFQILEDEMPVKLRGLDEMKANLKKVGPNARAQVVAAVEAEANRMLEEAKARVPVETGALRDSGTVTMVETGSTVKAVISFGNDEVDYAVEVHENLDAHHEHGGQAKFLESVLDEGARQVLPNLAKQVQL